MEEFKGMSRNTTRVKTPTGMWEFARNILLQKGFQSVSNEYGFESKATIPGIVIGHITTNEEIVVFSVDGEFSCIGLIKSDDLLTYIPKVRSIYLGFKVNRPIEGVFLYNYNKELITIWCDGVFVDSNVPRLLNLTNLNIEVDANYEFVNPADLDVLNLFSSSQEGQIYISYGNEINLPLNVVYITYTYILDDGISTTGYYPVHHIAYPYHNWESEQQRSIIIDLQNLDIKYSQIKLGLLVNYEDSLIAYSSPSFSYTGTSLTIEITSLSNFVETSVDNLVIPTIYYNRIKSMTIQNNQLVIGNVATDNQYNIQKFINKLELGLKYVLEEEKFSHPTLCPDEVYAVYIQPQLTNSDYLEAYPLIGPKPNNPNETDILTASDLEAMGLRDSNNGIEADTWKQFHIKNTGGFVLPAPFDETDEAHYEMNWGFWENEETYPNHPHFDGTVDYDGNPIVGGEDLRNTPIRYFRVPGLDAVSDKIPCHVGSYYKNDLSTGRNFGTGGEITKFFGAVPRFGVYIKNWEEVIPDEIKERLQGFRLLIVKRKTGDRIVEDINFQMKVIKSKQEVDGTDRILEVTNTSVPGPNLPAHYFNDVLYGYTRVYSSNLMILKPQIAPRIVKANYIRVLHDLTYQSIGTYPDIGQENVIGSPDYSYYVFKVKETQKYAEFKGIEYKPGNNIAAETLFVEEGIIGQAKNYLQGIYYPPSNPYNNRWNPFLVEESNGGQDYGVQALKFNSTTRVYEAVNIGDTYEGDVIGNDHPFQNQICASYLNLYKNLYLGFNPSEFIVLGRVLSSNSTEVVFSNGDIFTNNAYTGTRTLAAGGMILGKVYFNRLYYKGMWGINGNSLCGMAQDKELNVIFDVDDDDSHASELLALDYTIQQKYVKAPFKSLNDYITAVAFNINGKTVGYFPFRVARTPKISNENLQTDVLRTFRANDYYEMLNNRGEVIAVRGTNKQLFIQQKYSLFVATLKDKLNTGETETYLGEGDIFDRSPDEIKYNTDKGYIGCTNQFASLVVPDGYVVVDQLKGNIFLIGSKFMEISKAGMTNWFQENWNTEGYFTLDRFGNKQPVDNPFVSIGHLIGYDEEFNRLLFTKKYYKFLFDIVENGEYTFDGEFYYKRIEGEEDSSTFERLDFNDESYFENLSKTFSFNIDDNTYVCEHDYFPNVYMFNTYGLFSINNDRTIVEEPSLAIPAYVLYKHNVKTQQRGTYYKGSTYDSYIDLIFNGRLDLSKQYQMVTWESVVKALDGSRKYKDTIDKIMIYSDYQCSGEIDITEYNTSRNVEGVWQFNEFRDIVVDNTLPIIREDGRVDESNLNINKSFFEKSFFIGTFVVIRLIMTNSNTNDVFINLVNVKSRISKR